MVRPADTAGGAHVGSAAGADERRVQEQPSLRDEKRIPIRKDQDIVAARQQGRALAQRLGFSNSNLTLIATAISELARNILLYAKTGEMSVGVMEDHGRDGIVVVARDSGPGITDIPRAMQMGYSTSGSLGLGLPGVKRLMDEFDIVSKPGRGTMVTATKWRK